MLNNLNKITATPVKKKNNDATSTDDSKGISNDLKSKEPENEKNGDAVNIVVDEVQENKTE